MTSSGKCLRCGGAGQNCVCFLLSPKQRDELVGQTVAASVTLRDIESVLRQLATADNRALQEVAAKACDATRALMRAIGYAEEDQSILNAVLHCPWCGTRHIDIGEWAERRHHTHLCADCGKTWRVEPYCRGIE